MEFDVVALASQARQLVSGRGVVAVSDDGRKLALLPDAHRAPITLHIDEDVVRLGAGSALRFTIGQDDPPDTSVLLDLVGAVLDGQAEEYVDIDSTGSIHFAGGRIWNDHGQFDSGTRRDNEGVRRLVIPLQPW
ncbi:MAG: hypothetical protein JWN36_473 [Microbacteriaceae bacterium]|nr:hypothetical protein [Microbacteriaceae bacterium]